METPRITRRTPARASMPSEVRNFNSSRTRLFSPADSGIYTPPSPRTPFGVHVEKKPGDPNTRKYGQASPMNNHRGAVRDRVDGVEYGSGWSRFWLIWVSIFVICSSCVIFAWNYFPDNKVVQRSQEYVVVGLLSVISLMIFTIMLKLVWQYCRGTRFNSVRCEDDVEPEVHEDWVDGYFSTPGEEPYHPLEMPDTQPGTRARSNMGHAQIPAGRTGQGLDVMDSDQSGSLSSGQAGSTRAAPDPGAAQAASSMTFDQCEPGVASK
ncbi:hypothetical protein FSP39_012691 [Pinctada imbricata]|uniref:Uncharacterized protein n=1 Tax=Pinctada imbricata TaxID=66713 RepID=A0AA89CDB8_PINIB|nr:hypothetical protein FSP39_012691 [Pinctada imbricata]